jgi:hypothetical protein
VNQSRAFLHREVLRCDCGLLAVCVYTVDNEDNLVGTANLSSPSCKCEARRLFPAVVNEAVIAAIIYSSFLRALLINAVTHSDQEGRRIGRVA